MSEHPRLTRRQFVATSAAATGALSACRSLGQAPAAPRRRPPHVIFMHIDQCHADALTGHGTPYVATPNMDRLLARGTSFRQAYSANPVCCPCRSTWYTGRCSSETGVLLNQYPLRSDLPDLGQWLGARNYLPVYAGKWHIPRRNVKESFRVLSTGAGLGEQCDAPVSRAAEAFLREHSGDQPFFLNLGFIQPHDICHWIALHKDALAELPFAGLDDQLPPLPDNFGYDEKEPETFLKIKRPVNSKTPGWTALHWRYYLWSYYRHVEMVDAELGRVLDALDDKGLADQTAIVFAADHGEGLARHQTVLKSFLYDEAARVPTVVCWPGELPAGRQDTQHLVSGLDLPATICAMTGNDAPPQTRGRSLLPILKDDRAAWREFLVSESHITGRMVRTPEYKLIRYEGDATAQLFDLRDDPGEMHNRIDDGALADVRRELEQRLTDWDSRLELAKVETAQKPDDPDE